MKASVLAIAAGALLTLGSTLTHAAEPSPPRISTAPEKGPAPSAQPFVANIDELASKNDLYRRVIFTGRLSQLALMSIPAGSDIGYESHANVEQILFIESGRGRVTINGESRDIGKGDVIVVPSGIGHDVVNTGEEPLKIYTVYTPPNHIPGREQATKAAAEADHADQEYGRKASSPAK